MNKIFLIIALLFLCSVCDFAQTEPQKMDEPLAVCITQADANKLFSLAQKGKSFDEYKTQAERDITERDKIIENLKINLATETQRGSDRDAEIVRLTAIIEFLLKNGRVKKYGIINLF